jgi:predicted transcriptional regulator
MYSTLYSNLHERVVTRLQAHKGRWPTIAKRSGVPYSSLRKIAQGTTKTPAVENLETLDRFLDTHIDIQ